jgi:hypothetical protein
LSGGLFYERRSYATEVVSVSVFCFLDAQSIDVDAKGFDSYKNCQLYFL